jgi:hypothetical protein
MIRIYAMTANRPEFIPWQHRSLVRFLSEPFEYVVINNGKGQHANDIDHACQAINVAHVRVSSPRHDLAGEGHIRSFEFCRDNYLKNDSDISCIIDGDMFLAKPFNIREWLGHNMLAGLSQAHGHVRHFFSGIIFMDLARLPDREQFSIGGGVVDGQGCDVGGQSYYYLRDHPQVPVRWMGCSGQIMDRMNNLDQLPANMLPSYKSAYAVEILERAWLHHREGSKWDNQDDTFYAGKAQWCFDLLDACISGRSVMP